MTGPAGTQKHRKVFSRFNDTEDILNSIRDIQADPDTYREFRKASGRWLTEPVWTGIAFNLFLYRILQSYEFITKIFLDILDGKKLKGLKRHHSVLDIITGLPGDIECGEFRDLLNNGLRNALAHDDYWIEEGDPDRLVYEAAPGGLTFGDLVAEHNRIHRVLFTLHAWYGDWLHIR